MNRDTEFLRKIDAAKTPLELQRLQIEAIMKHAESLDRVADAIYNLSDPDHGLAFESYSRLKIEQKTSD